MLHITKKTTKTYCVKTNKTIRRQIAKWAATANKSVQHQKYAGQWMGGGEANTIRVRITKTRLQCSTERLVSSVLCEKLVTKHISK